MKAKYPLALTFGMIAFMSCSKDDLKPFDPNQYEIDKDKEDEKDPITWSRSSFNYNTFVWKHHAKGDTCTCTKESASFYVGRNYNTGDCYVKHIKATEPIRLYINHSEQSICTGCNSMGYHWYQNVSGYKYCFEWGGRDYWVTDLPADLKN